MSTETSTGPCRRRGPGVRHGTPAPPALEGRPGVPFARTLQAELRKMVDTRAGRWMVIVMAAAAVLILAAFVLWGPAEDALFRNLLSSPRCRSRCCCPSSASWPRPRSGPSAPGWSPSRSSRVAAASCSPRRWPPSPWAGRPRRSPSRPPPSPTSSAGTGTWDLDAAAGAGLVLALLIYVLQGVAFGLLFLNTPVAIVPSWSCPRPGPSPRMVFSSLDDVGRWINLDSVTASAVRRGDGGPGLGPARHRHRRVGAAAAGDRHVAGAHIVR